MEPVFMILGQAAGTAACFAIDEQTNVQSISIEKLQAQLTADKQAIGPDADDSAIIVDDADASGVSMAGSWTSSSSSAGYYGSDYLHDGNTNKGASSVTFTPTLPRDDLYQVYARWTANANRAGKVPIDIISPSGTKTVTVDQTQQGGQWVLLLTTNFNAGTAGQVRLRNTGTSGYVIADAVKFVEGENLPKISLWSTDAAASRLGPQPAIITVNRTGNANVPVTITFNIGGTAINGADYHAVSETMFLPAGVSVTNISILPFTNSEPVGEKSVTVSLATNAAYQIGPLNSASVLIDDTPIYQWRLNYFGTNAANAAIAGNTAAPAGDGVANLLKYALGLNPTQEVTQPLLIPQINSTGYFQIACARPDPPPADVSYRMESSNDLVSWCTSQCVVVQQILFSNQTAMVIYEDPTPVQNQPGKFVRLRVSRQ